MYAGICGRKSGEGYGAIYEKNNELMIIIITTVTFGVLGRLLVRVPYMAFGDFSSGFFISATLWWVYNSLLFHVTYSMRDDEKSREPVIKVIMYAGLATLIKMGIDTCIDWTAGHQPNMLILVAAMEISMLLYALGFDYFLFTKIRKKQVREEKKGINALIISLCSLLVLYAGTLFYYMKQVKYAVEQFGDMPEIQTLGLDNAIWNLTTTLGRESTTVGTIVYVGCFILIWCIMDKITIEKGKLNDGKE